MTQFPRGSPDSPGRLSSMSDRDISTQIIRRLQSAGFEAFWVGGCVRDMLLDREPIDYDVATSARPQEIEALFPRTVPVGRQFGVLLVIEDGKQFQVATFRAEAGYEDGRRPGRVEFSNAKADAFRRDFTVNGLFFDPVKAELHDWVGGEADLRAKVLRTIGSPEERFAEDHLRLLRAIRFAAQLGFEIEHETFDALRANAPKIATVSAERIREELMRLFRPPHAARGLDLLRESGLLEHIVPELIPAIPFEQFPQFHPEGTVFNHLRLMLRHLPADAHESLPWAVLMHDIAKPQTTSIDPDGTIHFYGHEKLGADMTETVLRRLRFPGRQIDEIVRCVLCHMQFKDVKQMRKSTVRRLLMRKTFPLELQLHRLDCLGSHGRLDNYNFLLERAEELSRQPAVRPPLLKGDNLIALGMQPGPALGALLAELREKQLQDELKTREEGLEWAKRRLADSKRSAEN